MTLEDAIEDILPRRTQSPARLGPLADFVVGEFERRGLPDVRGGSGGEHPVPGLARTKQWDIAYRFAGKPRLIVSLKSIQGNAGGAIPNRIDDLIGETANVQQLSPEIVTGYVVLFDVQADTRRKDGLFWSEYFERAVRRLSIRRAPLWNQGLLEGVWFILFDSQRPPGLRLVNPVKALANGDTFFQALLSELSLREPAIPLTAPHG